MDTTLTIINNGLDLKAQHILVYLKPQGSNTDWETAAWQSCAPQPNGGSYILEAINNDIGAYVTFNGDRQKTALQIIPPHNMSVLDVNGNEIWLNAPELDSKNLTPQQCGIINQTTLKDSYPVWCVNGSSVCRPVTPMLNTGISTFELLQKVYLTVGSSIKTDNFIVQNWAQLTEIDIPSNLVSANIYASVDNSTNKPVFKLKDPVYN